MGIVFPNEAITRRWDGALQARLRRAPLEAFLRARSLLPAPVGVAQDSDNLIRATGMIVEAGLARHLGDRVEGLAMHQRAIVGHVACLVSRGLAELISQPAAWRIVALVSAARVLTPWIGLNAAAMSSASSTRQFQRDLTKGLSSLDQQIIDGACAAINRDGVESMAEISANIAARLNTALLPHRDCAAEDLVRLGG